MHDIKSGLLILQCLHIFSYWILELLQELYQKALSVKSAIPHPRIMGIIRECGGKMHMAERQWPDAATDFFEAFKNYDEAGNQRRIQCLKYSLNSWLCSYLVAREGWYCCLFIEICSSLHSSWCNMHLYCTYIIA